LSIEEQKYQANLLKAWYPLDITEIPGITNNNISPPKLLRGVGSNKGLIRKDILDSV
jgi:hypothetical protein